MSDSVYDVNAPAEAPTEPTNPKPQQKDLEDEFEVGYVVGITTEGKLFWKPIGTKKTLIGLLGTHEFASLKIKNVLEIQQQCGDKITADVADLVVELHKKFDTLSEALGVKLSRIKNDLNDLSL